MKSEKITADRPIGPVADPLAMTETYVNGSNAGDIDGVLSLYSDDAISVWEPGKPVRGIEHEAVVRAHLERKPVMQATIRESHVTGDTALLVVDWTIDIPGDGKLAGEHHSGLGLDVLRKGEDDLWRYVVDNPFGEANHTCTSERQQGWRRNMTASNTEVDLSEPHMRGMLASVGLDVEYVRGVGDILFYRTDNGIEVPVLDLVGGYGCLVFGHNHPALVEKARQLLADQVPIHAQFSFHPYANSLAIELNSVIQRELKVEEPYTALFGNSGAEAVEIAMKHAELDRGTRISDLQAHVVEAWRAAENLAPFIGSDVYDRLGLPNSAGFDQVARTVQRANEVSLSRGPVFLALEGGFHGKLAGSVQMTHNPGYRTPFSRLATQARFIAIKPGAVQAALAAERMEVILPEIIDGALRLTGMAVPRIAGFFVEPIQGEGGIKVLDPDFADEIRSAADAGGFPVIVDEIQSGMGRTGKFFAAAHIGLIGDYILLAKGIGGGIAKSSVAMIRSSRYNGQFELLHSSTFAKDAFSVNLGLSVVRMLEANGGGAYAQAEERGAALRAEFESVRAQYPDVVSDVRGLGLMLGFELKDLSNSADPILSQNAAQGIIGYVFAGYLLREYGVRIFPTASNPHTLRAEPSINLSDSAIAQVGEALRGLCVLLRKGDGAALLTG